MFCKMQLTQKVCTEAQTVDLCECTGEILLRRTRSLGLLRRPRCRDSDRTALTASTYRRAFLSIAALRPR